jgi:hypothetical protein
MDINGGGVLFGNAPDKPQILTPLTQAKELLILLLQNGRMKSKAVESEFDGAGISRATMKCARKELAIISKRENGIWWLSLPAKPAF